MRVAEAAFSAALEGHWETVEELVASMTHEELTTYFHLLGNLRVVVRAYRDAAERIEEWDRWSGEGGR